MMQRVKNIWTNICEHIWNIFVINFLNGFQKEEEYACEAIWGMTGGGQLHPEVGHQIIKIIKLSNYQIIKW